MSHDLKNNEKHPEIRFSLSNIADARDAGLFWFGNKLDSLSNNKMLTHGPLAAITLPMAIALRETGYAFRQTSNTDLPILLCSIIGVVSTEIISVRYC